MPHQDYRALAESEKRRADAMAQLLQPSLFFLEQLDDPSLDDGFKVQLGALVAKIRATATPIEPDEYYVLDNRSCVGNCAIWWCPDRKGYTTQLSEAGIYDAKDIESMRKGIDVGVPRAIAERVACRHVRTDWLREQMTIPHPPVSDTHPCTED